MADNIKEQGQINSTSENWQDMPPLNDTKIINLLKSLLNESVIKCYTRDRILIEKGLEQSSVARIFYYMQNAIDNDKRFQIFRKHNLDCEYYKNIDDKKITPTKPYGSKPDLILHKRGSNDYNILVCEFKCTDDNNSDYESDYNKLKDFTSSICPYHYKLGIFIRLKAKEFSFAYFKEGKEIPLPKNNLTT